MSRAARAAYDYDLFVIGAGSGGVRASRVAASHGAKVAVAEEYRVGGTCVIRGCVPKKLLVYGAQFAKELHDAAHYGWTVADARFDWPTLRDAVKRDVDRLNGLYTQTLEQHHVTWFPERACITGPHTLRLASGREISARVILIAAGAWPVMPDFEGQGHCITSNEVFDLPELPRRVVIQGGGYIAMEFAGIFNALGSEVTLVNRSDRVLRAYDESLSERLMAIMQARGIRWRPGQTIRKVAKRGDGTCDVYLTGDDPTGEGQQPWPADAVLIATGRKPKTEGLGLETAGIALGSRGEVPVLDAAGRTACPSIYAVGDVTDRVQLTPMAIREGQAFADAIFGARPAEVSYDCVPSAVFSQPPIAAVGLTEAEARARYGHVKIFQSDFRPMKNIFSKQVERGFYKLVVDGDSERILGVHMIGPEAPEILQAVAIAVKAGLRKGDFDATIALHPSMAEELVLMK